MARFRVKQTLEVVVVVEAASPKEAAGMLPQCVESAGAVEALAIKSQVVRLKEEGSDDK